MNILVTGGAGFIGSSLIDKLIMDRRNYVISVDNYDDYYCENIKIGYQKEHFFADNFEFHNIDIRNINDLSITRSLDCIIHLAAKAGVRSSIDKPNDYFDVNVLGTLSMLEFAKQKCVRQFLFASSSSVYGINPNVPWSENDAELMPISPYAASKVAAEKLGYTYSVLYGIRFLALRFFTVYGPRQRPDLAINKFIKHMLHNQPIEIFGDGNTYRDYTFIDDIVQGIISSMHYNKTNYEVINLGNNSTTSLNQLLKEISILTGIKPLINYKSEQLGDVSKTCASTIKSKKLLGFIPKTSIHEGLKKQLNWIIKNNYDL